MKLRSRTIHTDRPIVMGIVNVTPDSFSDGGRYSTPEAAVAQAMRQIDEGADIIDVGGESTRPGSLPVTADEELGRIIPVIEGIRARGDMPISVDTQKAAVAKRACDAGADIINDISAGLHDPRMLDIAAQEGVPVVLMHMQGRPQTMQDDPRYGDLMAEIASFLGERINAAERAGVESDNIIIDPGIGFGKTAEDNVDIILNIDTLHDLNKPILLGSSRKSFIGKLLGYEVKDRLEATLATLSKTYEKGVRMFRVHDVGPARRYLATVEMMERREAAQSGISSL